MSNSKEEKNKEYLDKLLGGNTETKSGPPKETVSTHYEVPSVEYSNISLNILPTGRFYPRGTKISIRAAKVAEIQAYSMVDDNNFVDITEKMNELLARNIIFTHPDGSKGSYKNIKDSDRVFLIFMIRELTFQGGNTLTREATCPTCGKEFHIPFRSTPGANAPTTFELHEPNESIEKFFNKEKQVYELVYNGVSWELAPPTIGVQEDFYAEIKRNVQADKKPDVAFMKIMPFLLHDKDGITEDTLKTKLKEFKAMEDLVLFQGFNNIVNKMTVGIKGLKMNCPECGTEVHTDLTFPGGASTLFELPDIMDRFGK
jgi:predicted RNA-binding Zn-ribbon protein involved in translation (DUF1610 family)